jgi:hypothetical protein
MFLLLRSKGAEIKSRLLNLSQVIEITWGDRQGVTLQFPDNRTVTLDAEDSAHFIVWYKFGLQPLVRLGHPSTRRGGRPG